MCVIIKAYKLRRIIMKNKRLLMNIARIIFILTIICSLLVFSFVGCSDTPEPTPEPTPAPTPEPTPEPTPPPTPAPKTEADLLTELNASIATALANNAPDTPHEIMVVLNAAHVDFEPFWEANEAAGHKMGMDITTKRFVIIDPNNLDAITTKENIFVPVMSAEDYTFITTNGFSLYLIGPFSGTEIALTGAGLDVGANAGIETITYTGATEAHSVVIRTNGGDLRINAANDTVKHYGEAREVDITAIAMSSYEENGVTSGLALNAGKVVVGAKGYVAQLAVDKDATASTVAIVNNGNLIFVDIIDYKDDYNHDMLTPAQKDEAAAKAFVATVETSDELSGTINIGLADTLRTLAILQCQGYVTGPINISITADINLSGGMWIPFGAQMSVGTTYPFEGSINGNGHKIIGLNDTGFMEIPINDSQTIKGSGEAYGFIAMAKNDVTISNLTFENVNITKGNAKSCAAVIGQAGKQGGYKANVVLKSVSVTGAISAADKTAALVAYTNGSDADGGHNLDFNSDNPTYTKVVIDDCHVDASITANQFRAGGFIAQIGQNGVCEIKDSSFAGSVTVNQANDSLGIYSGAFIGFTPSVYYELKIENSFVAESATITDPVVGDECPRTISFKYKPSDKDESYEVDLGYRTIKIGDKVIIGHQGQSFLYREETGDNPRTVNTKGSTITDSVLTITSAGFRTVKHIVEEPVLNDHDGLTSYGEIELLQ